MKRVAIYVRVSTQEQAAEGYSIGEQTDRLKKYCEAHDWIHAGTYTDPGFSGAKMDRPALQQLIKDTKHGLFDTVLVYKLDRLSRSQKDTMYLIEDVFIKNNIAFISMNENFDTGTPFGRAMIGILSVFAQLERDQIKERMQMGLDARAKEGLYHGGPYAPIGYDYKDGELIVNDYEATIVRKTYELFLDGMNTHAIFRYLDNHYDVSTKYGRLTDSSVRSILSSVIYTGMIEWKGSVYAGRHTPLISSDDFEKVQSTIKERQIREPWRKTAFQHTTILGGLIFCGNCGARYYCKDNSASRVNKIVQRYYTCYSRGKSSKKMIKDPNCKNPSWNTNKLEELVIGEIEKLELSRDFDEYVVPSDNTEKVEALKSSIASVEKKLSKLIDLYSTDIISISVLTERVDRLNREKAALEDDLEELLNAPAPALSIPETNEILNSFHKIIKSGETAMIRNLVRSLIDTIIIYPDTVEIHWRFASSL